MVVSVCYILKLWTDWSILNYTWHLAIVHAVIRLFNCTRVECSGKC